MTFNHWVTGSNPVALTTFRFVETYILQQIGRRACLYQWTVLDNVGHPTAQIALYSAKCATPQRKSIDHICQIIVPKALATQGGVHFSFDEQKKNCSPSFYENIADIDAIDFVDFLVS